MLVTFIGDAQRGVIIPKFFVVRLLLRAGDDLEGGGSEILRHISNVSLQ